MKITKHIILFLILFIVFSLANVVSADTTYISTPNGTTTIVSGPSASTYAPGDTVKVNVSYIVTNDPYATHITLTGNNAGAGATTIIDTDFDVNSYITALVNVGTAGAPKAGYNIAMTGTVTWSAINYSLDPGQYWTGATSGIQGVCDVSYGGYRTQQAADSASTNIEATYSITMDNYCTRTGHFVFSPGDVQGALVGDLGGYDDGMGASDFRCGQQQNYCSAEMGTSTLGVKVL